MNLTENAIYPPKGYTAAGLHCGLKDGGEKDLALIVSDRPASAAGMFTTNRVCAAPVQINREHLRDGRARAVVVNSKNANACTGEQGMRDAKKMALVRRQYSGNAKGHQWHRRGDVCVCQSGSRSVLAD